MKISKILLLATAITIANSTTSFSQANAQTKQTATTTKTINTKVKGITCGNDLKTIATNVEKLNGVSACKTGNAGATSKFTITYDPGLVTEEQIYAAIQDTPGCEDPNDRPYKVKK